MKFTPTLKTLALSGILACSTLSCSKNTEITPENEAIAEEFMRSEIKKDTDTYLTELVKEKIEKEQYVEPNFDPVHEWGIGEAKRHDKTLLHTMNKVNRLCSNLPGYEPFTEPGLLRAWLVTESWNGLEEVVAYQVKENEYPVPKVPPPQAWLNDPAQIANNGDFALSGLQVGGTEDAQGLLKFLPKDAFEEFQGLKHTPRGDGKWDYTNTTITPQQSIYGALLWLADKKHDENIEIIPQGNETIIAQQGFNYFNELKARGLINTHVDNPSEYVADIFAQYNPNITNPQSIQIGQEVHLPESGKLTVTLTSKGDAEALLRYNGGGDIEYLDKIASKKHIPTLDF